MTKPLKTTIHISNGSRSHNHRFELVFFDGCPPQRRPIPHAHPYEGITSFEVGHNHRLYGETAPALADPEHVHEYEGTTTFDDGHVHYFCEVTSQPIPLPNGGHYHRR